MAEQMQKVDEFILTSRYVDKNCRTIFNKVKALFADPAQEELQKAEAEVISWIRERIQSLKIATGRGIKLELNDYNNSLGIGLQSVRMLVTKNGEAVRSA